MQANVAPYGSTEQAFPTNLIFELANCRDMRLDLDLLQAGFSSDRFQPLLSII